MAISGWWSGVFSAFGTVEHHPGAEIIAEVFEAMHDSSRNKQHIAAAERVLVAPVDEDPEAACNEIHLIAIMRFLPVHFSRPVHFYLQRSVFQDSCRR